MSLRWRFIELLAPVLRMLPPWYRVRAYHRLTGHPFRQGGFAGRVVSRTIWPHGFRVRLHLDDWMERFAAFTGMYYEVETTEAVRRLLRPGDVFIDVGANVGFVTLIASAVVGVSGKVISVEPNKELLDRLRETCAENGVTNVEFLQCGFGDKTGSGTLSGDGHHGSASLRRPNSGPPNIRIVCGDDAIPFISGSVRCLVKIDVEGYEQRVLNGMSGLLNRPLTAFLVEITDEWLASLGGGAQGLFASMREAGYEPFRVIAKRASNVTFQHLSGHQLSAHQYDAIFLRPSDGWLG